jgi:aspartyl/asparaginyl-tRNA synthetase
MAAMNSCDEVAELGQSPQLYKQTVVAKMTNGAAATGSTVAG